MNVLFIADPDDVNYPDSPTTALVDLAELDAGSATGFGLTGELDLGDASLDTVFLEAHPAPGAIAASSRHPVKQMTVPIQASFATMDDYLAAARDLAKALLEGGVMVWQPEGATDPVYIDFYPSPPPGFVRGQERGLFKFAKLLMEPDGAPLTIRRHPLFRRPRQAAMSPATQTVTNEVGGREILVSNPGNALGQAIVTVTPEAGADIAQVRIGRRSKGNLTEFATIYAAEIEAGTLYGGAVGDTSSVAEAGGSGGNVARVSFTNIQTMARRARVIFDPTDNRALRGTYRVYARLAPSGASDPSEFRVQARWGTATTDPLAQSNDVVPLDFGDVDNPTYVDVDLGYVMCQGGVDVLVIDLWAARDDGTASLDLDALFLVPADEQFLTASIPGFRYGSWGRERWKGDELEGTGTVRQDTMRLNATDETAVTPPAGGFSLTQGVHLVEARVVLRNTSTNKVREEWGRVEVLDDSVTPGTVTNVRKSVKLKTRKNRRDTRRSRRLRFEVTAADITAGRKFRFRVRFTKAAPPSGSKIIVRSIRHRFQQPISETYPLVIDGTERRAYGKQGSSVAFPVMIEGTFLELPPGDSILIVSCGDLPRSPAYDDIDEREPLPRSIKTRSCSVSIDVIPRSTH